jgi:hypothetical protein
MLLIKPIYWLGAFVFIICQISKFCLAYEKTFVKAFIDRTNTQIRDFWFVLNDEEDEV